MNAVTQAMGLCPCGFCGLIGTKLTKYGHLISCSCSSCIGRRNRRSGQRTEAKRHRRLGGQGDETVDV